MLGRTANGLYWMFRYIERAENIARLIDAGLRMSLTRSGASDEDWDGVLQSAGVREAYAEVHAKLTGVDAIDYLLRDRSNPSSVMSCIEFGRNNARMVRTALTRETWEATNECWMELKQLLAKKVKSADLPQAIDVIKRRAGLIRGAFHGSMLRNELYNFARIGTFIERADNTSRILDVKYYVLLPSVSPVGSSLDNVQWESILRSVSAHRSYSWVYDAEYRPANIADFLILNGQMPRSLAYCYEKIVGNLHYLEKEYGERLAAHETADAIRSRLQTMSIQEIMDRGLHEFLELFVSRNNQLSQEITEDTASTSKQPGAAKQMKLKITHITEYAYDGPVQYSLQRLRLTPTTSPGQTIAHWAVSVEGAAVEVEYGDQFGNHVELVSNEGEQKATRIIASGEVETEDRNGVFGAHVGYCPLWLFLRETPLTKPGKLVKELARGIEADDPVARLHALMAAIHAAVAYEEGTTTAATTAEAAMDAKTGVCQDHAHIFLAAARLLGIPARYISGYLLLEGTVDQAAMHAWAEAHVPGLGWVGFDPANKICPDDRYVRIASGLDYTDAAPVSGMRFGSPEETLTVAIAVEDLGMTQSQSQSQ